MTRSITEHVQRDFRSRLISCQPAHPTKKNEDYAGQLIAAFFRCSECGSWWIAGKQEVPEAAQVFNLVEPHSDRYLWQDYRGWRHSPDDNRCGNCGRRCDKPDCELRFDENGRILWPRLRLLEGICLRDGLLSVPANA